MLLDLLASQSSWCSVIPKGADKDLDEEHVEFAKYYLEDLCEQLDTLHSHQI
jgi:hypothetical protein